MNRDRFNGLVKVGFYKAFEKLKYENSKEIDNFTTKFRLSWLESDKLIVGTYSLRRFLSKFIRLSLNQNDDPKKTLIIIIDENIIFPIDDYDIKKLENECRILGGFMSLFSLYQIYINKTIKSDFVVSLFISATSWLLMPIKDKVKHKKSYFEMLINQEFGFENNKLTKEIVEFAKNLDMYPEEYSKFVHHCILDSKNKVRTFIKFIVMEKSKDHTESCDCYHCTKRREYLINVKSKR
jgi:hypothetical protein